MAQSKQKTINDAIKKHKLVEFNKYLNYVQNKPESVSPKKFRDTIPIPLSQIGKKERKRLEKFDLVPVLDDGSYKTFVEKKMKNVHLGDFPEDDHKIEE